MRKLLSLSILINLFLFGASCNKIHYPRYNINSILPRESFVKIVVSVYMDNIENEISEPFNIGSAMASGAIVKKTTHGSYILTAEHVCTVEAPFLFSDPEYKTIGVHNIIDIDKNDYDSIIYHKSDKIDACIIFAKDLKNKPAIKLKQRPPDIGDKVYNLAAPAGFFNKNMVPIFEGIYSGQRSEYDIYTIPAMGGSSGSPVIDDRGYLIGMIFAVHRGFPFISFSPTNEQLYNFLKVLKKAPQFPKGPSSN